MAHDGGKNKGGNAAQTRPASELRNLAFSILPMIILAVFVIVTSVDTKSLEAKLTVSSPRKGQPPFTTVVVIIDSMSEQVARRAEIMPNLQRLVAIGVSGPQKSCAANFTTPCLITAFEGRQSPFMASVRNFSARASNNPNYLSMLRKAGWRPAIISDHTLTQLYPRDYVEGINYDKKHIPFSKRDTFAIDQTYQWLEQNLYDVIVVHIVGTDRVAHRYLPDHKEYARIFSRADAFIGGLLQRLDLAKDSLVVFGDHGHGKGGHHTRQTWYAAVGPDIAQRTIQLDQPTLLFLLAGIHRLALPVKYEGALAWDIFKTGADWLIPWRQTIAQGWLPVVTGAKGDELEKSVKHLQQLRDEQPLDNLVRYFPWLSHILLVAVALLSVRTRSASLPVGFAWFQVAWLGLAIISGWNWVPWVALGPQTWFARVGWSKIPGLLIWTALAAISGLLIPWIFNTFHVKSGFSLVNPAWFSAFVIIPMLFGFFFKPLGHEQRFSQAVLMILVCAAFLATPGVYYYSVAQMVHVLLFPLTLLILLLEVIMHDRKRWPLLAVYTAGMPFMYVTAGAWNWGYILHIRLGELSSVTAVFSGVLALIVCPFMWRIRSPLLAATASVLLFLKGWLLNEYFQFDLERVIGFSLLLVSLSAALNILAPKPGLEQSPPRKAWRVMVLAGFTFVALWSSIDGFFLKNLRFQYALDQFVDTFQTEAAFAAAVAGLVSLKYLLVVVPVVAAATFSLGPRQLLTIAPWVILAVAAKLIMQSIQTTGVGFVEVVRASELLIQEIAGMSFMGVSLWLCLMGLAIAIAVNDSLSVSDHALHAN